MRISDWSSDVCSSDLAVGLGATLTWYSPDGFYADAQARFSWFSSDLKSTILGRLAKNNDGEGQAFSMELGKRWAAGSKLSITPQVQLTWSDIGFDAFTDPHGALVSNDYCKNLEGRAGISLDHRNSWQDSSGKSRRSHVYGIANLNYEFLDGTRSEERRVG